MAARERRREQSDDGVVAVLFAVLLVVVIGAGALIADVGMLYAEGRQLQNGAENAALVVARNCALKEPGCKDPTAAGGVAATVASSNAMDGVAGVANGVVCGNVFQPDPCTYPSQDRARLDCRRSSVSAFVEVRTETRQSGGITVLPPLLSRTFGNEGTTVTACARALYGSPAGLADLLPMAMPRCAWESATKNGSVYPDPGPPLGTWPSTSPERIYYFHQKAPPAPGCETAKYPGNFGWLDDTDNDGDPCKETTTMPGLLDGSNGNNPVLCHEKYQKPRLAGSIVLVPVYEGVVDPAANPLQYKGVSYAAFYISGYRFSGLSDHVQGVTKDYPCKGAERCISGWFVDATAPPGAALGNLTNMGVFVVRLAG